MATMTAKFRANPLKFMATHLVMVQVGGLTPQTKGVRLVEDNTKTCRTKLRQVCGKGNITVCKLVETTDTNDVLDVYWLPYQNNKVYHLQLGHAARFMFTPTMDGCSFSYGGQDPGRSPLVAHANMQNKQMEIDQVAIEDQLDALYNADYMIMKKDRYTGSKHFNVGSGHVRSTTFGISDGTNWRFWAQVWEDCHKGVAKKSALTGMDTTDPFFGSNKWDEAVRKAGSSYELLGVKPL
jgi:hypothetical protein